MLQPSVYCILYYFSHRFLKADLFVGGVVYFLQQRYFLLLRQEAGLHLLENVGHIVEEGAIVSQSACRGGVRYLIKGK